ncbi:MULTISPECIES: iron uptake porin [Okeania]|uniref:SLH domain-containing protein n=1 Tax=Okeania hirsuta TaxID=1458930 RepID=A0A3N6P7X9_9CYAN|nr:MULTISPECIES: iron uptake porin [Okeania]NES75632.1 carbohydrate porin [Okeania sp. SIO1H4]NES88653.1 carbohydrate porin [Okeania sp. SIO2B9]NET19023.1 carbohydrate porin [Okeania sp. SIO1H5]NET75360.1 carbohydrate porin [Okeania sp. SIO1F9]NET91903.1 carbohydrate porin [Okeania sp. SIO1H2]
MGRKFYGAVFPFILGIGFVLSITPSSEAKKQQSSESLDQTAQILETIEEYNPLKQPPQTSKSLEELDQKKTNIVTEKNDDTLGQIEQYNRLDQPPEISPPLERVNSVNQLSDVLPTDWAYSALQGLAERYGCLLASPNATFGGNRAISRYEFAANLNECLQVIQSLIEEFNEGYISQEDLAKSQRLQEDFAVEIADTKSRLNALETRTDILEANQFSTTTLLKGQVTMALYDAFGNDGKDGATVSADDSQLGFGHAVTLNFDTSFTGLDFLRTRLRVGDLPGVNTGTAHTFIGAGSPPNDIARLTEVYYIFPLNTKMSLYIGAAGLDFDLMAPALNPKLLSGNTGSIALFAFYNPVIYIQVGGAGLGYSYQINDNFRLDVAYLGGGPGGGTGRVNDPREGGGLFNGTNSAYAQLTVSPTVDFDFSFAYVRAYYTADLVNVAGFTGSRNAQRPFGRVATSADHFGFQTSYRWAPFTFSGWVGYSNAEAEAGDREGDEADIWNWAVTVAIDDLVFENGSLGISVGQQPKVTHIDNGEDDPDTSIQFQIFYNYRMSNNIDVTSGFFIETQPEHDDRNDPISVFVTRATWRF